MGQTSHPCPECGRVFPKRSNLKVHLRVHTGETPFPCNQCDKKFSWRSSWISHLAWHSGIAKPQKTRGTTRLAPTPQRQTVIQPAPTITPDVAGLAFLTANQQQQLEQMMMQQVNTQQPAGPSKQPAQNVREVQYANHAPSPQQPAMMVAPEQNGRQPVKVQAMLQPIIQPPMQPSMQPPMQPQMQPPPRAPMQAQTQNWNGMQQAHQNSNGYQHQRRKSVADAAMQASMKISGEVNQDVGEAEEHFSRQQRRKSQMIAEDAIMASLKIGNELGTGYDGQEAEFEDLDDINATLGATNSFSLAHLAPPPTTFNTNPPPLAIFGANQPRPADSGTNGVVKQDPGDETMQLSESFTNMLLNGQTNSEQENFALLAGGQAMSSLDRPTGSFPYGGSGLGSGLGSGGKTSSFGLGRPGGSGPRIPHAPLPARGIRPPVSNLWTHGSTGSHNVYEGMGDSIVNSRSRMSFSFKGVKSNSVHRSRTSLIGDPLYSFEVQGVQSPFRRSINGSINGMPEQAPEEAQEPQFFTEDRASYLGFSAAIGTFTTPLYDHNQNAFGEQINRG